MKQEHAMRIHNLSHTRSSERGAGRAWFRAAAIALLLLFPARSFAGDMSLVRSLLIPGLGQAQQGHYTRSAVLAGAAVVSVVGLFASQIYYTEAVNKLYASKHTYASYEEMLNNGEVVSIEELDATYADMEANYSAAEDRVVWRNGFLIGLAATYAVNAVDLLLSGPGDSEQPPAVSLQMGPSGFKITKAFRF